jgi:hypothetical protein
MSAVLLVKPVHIHSFFKNGGSSAILGIRVVKLFIAEV